MKRPATSEGAEQDAMFHGIVNQYYRPILVFFRKRGCNPESSADLTQDTFLLAFRSLATLRKSSSLQSWLFGIANNRWHNSIRSANAAKRIVNQVPLSTRHESELESQVAGQSPSPEDQALLIERLHLLSLAIGKLPTRMRQCLLLRVGEELRYDEIAAKLSVAPETVKKHLREARIRLRSRIEASATENS